ncbi:MAG: adenylate/guanylate cyclase domain-containing protein [Anaerolineae bacterium]
MNENIVTVPTLTQVGFANGKLEPPVVMPAAHHSLQDSQPQQCPVCSYGNQSEARFCLNCGTALGRSCPVCLEPIAPHSKFCGQCGTQLIRGRAVAAEPLPEEPALLPGPLADKIRLAAGRTTGERREVTVLFLDISNFTTTSYYLDSEEIYILVDEAMALLVEVLQKYGGTVDKFTGDGLMALFGAPVAHENDPERAVRAAMEMQSALRPLGRRLKASHGFEFQARIGINTGSVIAGNLGSDVHMEYTVIGDTVNLAARLEAAAQPGTILVSHETYSQTRQLFDFESLSPFPVKGLPEPVHAFRPKSIVQKPGSLRGLPGVESPMVGREALLGRLAEAQQQIRLQGKQQTVFVTGEAGLGKSRLIAEFRKTRLDPDVKVFQGACLEYTRPRPLWVVIDLIKDILQLPEERSGSLTRKILKNHLYRLNLALDETLPYLSHILELPQTDPEWALRLEQLDATIVQRQTFVALRQFLLAEIGQTPTVLVLEDLHWADPASRDFIEYFMQSSTAAPLLLILISRDAEQDPVMAPLFEAALRDSEHTVALQLRALSETETGQLVNHLVPQTDLTASTLKNAIVQRAAGNPFYVEEIIRMLIDQAALVHTPDTNSWVVMSGAGQKLKMMPGTIKGLILARFDRLPEGLRQTLQRAAVIGHTFSIGLLEKLHNVGREMLLVHLKELESRQFLTRQRQGSEWRYGFEHALTQETIYSTLLKRDRRLLHSRAAQVIADSPAWQGHTRAEALAYHLTRGSDPQQAIPYLITVADRAARRCAYETAAEHYRQAKQLMAGNHSHYGREFFEIYINLGRALKYMGDFTAASQVMAESIEQLWHNNLAADSNSLHAILVETMTELADVKQRAGNYDEAVNYLNSGLQLMGESGQTKEPAVWSLLMDRLAWVRFRQGQLEEADALANAAANTITSANLDNPIQLATIFNTLGGVAWKQGNLQQAITHVERSLELYGSVGYLWGRGVTLANLGVLNYGLGNWVKARYYYLQAYNLQQAIGDMPHQAISLENLGVLDMAMGQLDTGRAKLLESLAVRRRLGDTWGMAQALVNLAMLAIRTDQADQAHAHASEALALGETIGDDEVQCNARWVIGLANASQGNCDAGLKTVEQALARAQAGHYKEAEMDSLHALGVIYRQAGNPNAALEQLEQALHIAREIQARYACARIMLEMGRVYQSMPATSATTRDNATQYLQQAVDQFHALGATYDWRVAKQELGQIELAQTQSRGG